MCNFHFNFIPNASPIIHPNYRVEYEKNGGSSVSCPALFRSNKEAIDQALKEFPLWSEIGLNIVKVLKYNSKGKLEEIFKKES